jgi:hypothetical protein
MRIVSQYPLKTVTINGTLTNYEDENANRELASVNTITRDSTLTTYQGMD